MVLGTLGSVQQLRYEFLAILAALGFVVGFGHFMCSARAQPHIMRACSLRGCSYTLKISNHDGFCAIFEAFFVAAERRSGGAEATPERRAARLAPR